MVRDFTLIWKGLRSEVGEAMGLGLEVGWEQAGLAPHFKGTIRVRVRVRGMVRIRVRVRPFF